jgi:hypothetical protein
LCAQKQTIPLTALRFPIAQQEMTVQDGQLAILEAGNFTNDISICQVGWHVFLMALRYFGLCPLGIASGYAIWRDRDNVNFW